jgi:FtsH-binding integral membrane protein
MYNPQNNFGGNSFGRRNAFGSRFQYQALPRGYEGTQASGLISKVMGLLAFSFLFAFVGSIFGLTIGLGFAGYWVVAIGGIVVLIALNFLIQKPGINLFLLYLFTFLEGMALSPIVSYYLQSNGNILGEAFVITALTSLGLAGYAWTTKRDFTRLGDYLFWGLLLLIVAGLVGILFGGVFHSSLFILLVSLVGVAIFSGFVLYDVQRAKYMADTMPNAIGLTVSIFLDVLNLFLYILRILAILQGGDRNRR